MGIEIFHGRKMAIATKHKKETIIGPLLTTGLSVLPFAPANLDTDILGTFTGEIERLNSPLKAAREKCKMAMELTDCDLAISSEGSFGAHPTIGFLPCNEEIVLLVDKKNGLEILGRKLSLDTNFQGQTCANEQELIEFANKAGFPNHRLILKDKRERPHIILKGIGKWVELVKKFNDILEMHGQAYIETDMRAMYNPSRNLVIAEATKDLLKKATTPCTICSIPGFGITQAKKGLPCSYCGSATSSILMYILSCQKCGHLEEVPNPNATTEDPTYCDICNP